MPRILLLLPSATYRASDFVAAATRLGAEIVVGSDHRQAMSESMGDRAVVVPLAAPEAAVEAISALHERTPLDAVLAVDDQGVVVAALASARLGLPHNPPEAVLATRDKAAMRERLAVAAIPQPDFRVVPPGDDVRPAAAAVGYPCVLKPVSRSASQGVIRADDPAQAVAAARRIRTLLGSCPEPLVVERFAPGAEVAVEGLLVDGRLEVLALFDKPDPLDGPYFEETIYVTPSLLAPTLQAQAGEVVGAAAAALGLRHGPLHAELRINTAGGCTLLEVAARSIGGRCSRALRFGPGVSLEELIVRHALGLGPAGLEREAPASGVLMLPIGVPGVLDRVSGQDRARNVDGVVGLEISIPSGRTLVPLPEGDRYLGFVFASGPSPGFVEDALRQAGACLTVHLR